MVPDIAANTFAEPLGRCSVERKLDGRTIEQINRDAADQQLRCAVALAEVGYEYHRMGRSKAELRAAIVAEYAEFLKESNDKA